MKLKLLSIARKKSNTIISNYNKPITNYKNIPNNTIEKTSTGGLLLEITAKIIKILDNLEINNKILLYKIKAVARQKNK